MVKAAFLFPGQGAQHAGMGKDFYDQFPEARAVFDQAETILGRKLIDTIFSGPEELLSQTEYTQPAILTVSTAIYRTLEALDLQVAGLAGLSLGEYSALVAAKALPFEAALPLVQKRGLYMQEAAPLGTGKMIALMGLANPVVEDLCHRACVTGYVAPANYNCSGQVVIAGTMSGLAKAVELAREVGAKRITELKVSAPFHCTLLQPAEVKLKSALDEIAIKPLNIPVVFNVSGQFAADAEEIKANLIRQVSNPILWKQSVETLILSGIDIFIGLGPGNSLVRLMKRIAPQLKAYAVETVDDFNQLLKSIA